MSYTFHTSQLLMAAAKGDLSNVEILIENVDDHSINMAMDNAIRNQRYEVVAFLFIKRKVDADSALLVAASSGLHNIIELCLYNGATKFGMAIDLALVNNHHSAADLIRDWRDNRRNIVPFSKGRETRLEEIINELHQNKIKLDDFRRTLSPIFNEINEMVSKNERLVSEIIKLSSPTSQ